MKDNQFAHWDSKSKFEDKEPDSNLYVDTLISILLLLEKDLFFESYTYWEVS